MAGSPSSAPASFWAAFWRRLLEMLWSARIYHLYVATLAGCPGDNNGRGSLQEGDRVWVMTPGFQIQSAKGSRTGWWHFLKVSSTEGPRLSWR
ncbi:hypothetical protein BKA56DRAFT_75076 [Ilyonectria sp. MPI-CAGE-AT-0026]|nr:hypothetical protein BKA56DRAFT_75076 [Ilyonectria sp. MPI-CAGE-AT-0026]